ncbi:MAG: aminoacetone oxidase family FAD-binding enzyme [Rhodospirillaceae bacterium]|nr:MAG: aminoacetone oxidase family FAD-binding enzyme [Rhodospirillaceae bacterium]
MTDFDVIIIGAGAAGLMCAGEAHKRGRRVLILDHALKVGEKIRISGGGRANFSNLHMTAANYLSNNPRFCVSALKRYDQHDFIRLIERYNIAYHEREHGQLFCDGSATQIIDMLLEECRGARIQTETTVLDVDKKEDIFTVSTNRGPMTSSAVVVATGGPSIPKMGSSGFAYDVAKSFDLNVVEPRPGLVPLTFDLEILEKLDGLSGVSLDATVKLGKVKFHEALLFTHRGLSGPVILQISSYWREGDTLSINLLPGTNVFDHLSQAKISQPKKDVRTVLAQILPKSLATKMVDWTECNGRLCETSDKALRKLSDHVNAWQVTPNGSEGLRTAEVMVGGVDTKELSSKTMETNTIPGLYFIGEGVDVTGHLGGFNFQWAWASGQACGKVV